MDDGEQYVLPCFTGAFHWIASPFLAFGVSFLTCCSDVFLCSGLPRLCVAIYGECTRLFFSLCPGFSAAFHCFSFCLKQVSCHMMGYGSALSVYTVGGSKNSSNLSILLDDVLCEPLRFSGNASETIMMPGSLSDCAHRDWLTSDCLHNEDLGIECALDDCTHLLVFVSRFCSDGIRCSFLYHSARGDSAFCRIS